MLRQLAAAVLPLAALAVATGAQAERVVAAALPSGGDAVYLVPAADDNDTAAGLGRLPAIAGTDMAVANASSDPGANLALLANAVPTRRIMASARVVAGSGDARYSASEAGVLGATIARLPEPATWAMMLAGFALAALGIRSGIRRSEARFDERLRRIAAGEDLG